MSKNFEWSPSNGDPLSFFMSKRAKGKEGLKPSTREEDMVLRALPQEYLREHSQSGLQGMRQE